VTKLQKRLLLPSKPLLTLLQTKRRKQSLLNNKLLLKKRLSKELNTWLHTIKEVEETLTLAKS